MANLIHVSWRHPQGALEGEALRAVARQIQPAPLATQVPEVFEGLHSLLALTSPRGAAVNRGACAHLGAFAGSWPQWHEPGSPVPEGTFALVREDADTVEACSDFAGSRTLWYAFSESRLYVSTSQQALIRLLGGFQLNRQALAWFIASGSLGPSEAWDTRIQRLPRGARLRLDRATWSLHLEAPALAFAPEPQAEKACAAAFDAVLRTALQRFDFGAGRWGLPLSGGFDCRYMLTHLVEGGLRLPTMTWGLAASLHTPGNDAYVARQLAQHYGLPHDYLLTDMAADGPEGVVDTFLTASGGTTDQIFPYLDGMKLWTELSHRGFDGLIRGDEGFGWVPVRDEAHARSSVGLLALGDFMDPATVEALAGGPHEVPDAYLRQPGETLEMYRDRLYHGYRIPVGLAALNDVKAPFVEIAAPLLAESVLTFIRTMPDSLRTDKALFRLLATAQSPPIPYATMSADDSRYAFLNRGPFVAWMEAQLTSPTALELYPPSFLATLAAATQVPGKATDFRRALRSFLKRIIPTGWVKAARAQMGAHLPSTRTLALRAALAVRLVARLRAD